MSPQDNEARFALEDEDAFQIDTKPHGHGSWLRVERVSEHSTSWRPDTGDVHILLHSKGVARDWVERLKLKWIVFFQVRPRAVPVTQTLLSQDTNGLVFRSIPAALGVSPLWCRTRG